MKPELLTNIIGSLNDSVKLVVFNACFSELQAAVIVDQVPCAIGMNNAILDDAAQVFAAQFYSGIGFGLPLQRAFDQAILALRIADFEEADVGIPQLITSPDVDPTELILVRP